jgi:hypothetical protein
MGELPDALCIALLVCMGLLLEVLVDSLVEFMPGSVFYRAWFILV